MRGWLQCGAAHQRRTLIACKCDAGFQNTLLFSPVNGENLMILQPCDGHTEIVINAVNGIGIFAFRLTRQYSFTVHQFPQLLADGCVIGKILGDDITCASQRVLNGSNTLLLVYIACCKHFGVLPILSKYCGSKRLQPFFPGDTGTGTAFLFIGTVEVFYFR